MIRLTLLLSALLVMATTGLAGDLYKVQLNSESDAEQLAATGAEPIARLNDGFLVIADGDSQELLRASDLPLLLLATSVTKDDLALDNRLDSYNVDRYPLLYEDGRMRLYRVNLVQLLESEGQPGLSPVRNEHLQITFHQPSLDDAIKRAPTLEIDLDSLIGLVIQDSLYAHDSTLQAFNGRVAGSSSNRAARDWIAGKFTAFGYDSVMLDTFSAPINGTTQCYNVVATKVGTRFPHHHIVVGAHHDAVTGSPGADDNGSGTSGVIELARVLSGIETDMTFIFVTFDAEEYGLYGSWHYADEASARGDTIVYMFNMDMIGAINNATNVTVHHGSETNYSVLYNQLADSLLGLTGILSGNISQSDHWPFTQYDWTSTFIMEYNFSPVYHTYQDSTTYMDFVYMTKMVKSAVAVVYYVNATEGPMPSVLFSYPSGLPSTLPPMQTTTVEVALTGKYGGTPVAGSGMLYYDVDDHGWASSAMTETSPNLYEATLPAAPCDSRVKYYFSAEEAEMGTQYDPSPSNPYRATVATDVVVIVADNFETDQGWTAAVQGASSGQWQRGTPVNDPDWSYDPATDGDGSGQCYLTQNQMGNTDVDDGSVSLSSPVFDLSQGGFFEYDYYLKLTNEGGFVDRLLVEISSDGGGSTWTEVTRHDIDGGSTWHHVNIDELDLAGLGVSLTSNMVVRFTANDADPQSIVEAGVDGFNVTRYDCELLYLCADIDADGAGPNIADLVYLVDYMFNSGPAPQYPESADFDGDDQITIADLVTLVDFMFNDGPAPVCF
ncbi:MAG: M28 family peptidase [candidate division Zixibacteria bacterium]|nr:M28 family peptidase [candidate division Zixibacteria bacterium]MDH3936826.1 M28 family peptidase [candidate division Zixibacteria bacterium]MDH4033127.1 M28 family peptidase [candidate division Zixibacteria bacterium]